jgi:putative transposase
MGPGAHAGSPVADGGSGAQAIAQRQPPPGLVHHSDRGVQYACEDYAQILQQHQMIPSMSRPANPYDKDYASHCTSWVRCDTTSLARRRCDSFTPWAFRGGLSPGCPYRQSFLSLQA